MPKKVVTRRQRKAAEAKQIAEEQKRLTAILDSVTAPSIAVDGIASTSNKSGDVAAPQTDTVKTVENKQLRHQSKLVQFVNTMTRRDPEEVREIMKNTTLEDLIGKVDKLPLEAKDVAKHQSNPPKKREKKEAPARERNMHSLKKFDAKATETTEVQPKATEPKPNARTKRIAKSLRSVSSSRNITLKPQQQQKPEPEPNCDTKAEDSREPLPEINETLIDKKKKKEELRKLALRIAAQNRIKKLIEQQPLTRQGKPVAGKDLTREEKAALIKFLIDAEKTEKPAEEQKLPEQPNVAEKSAMSASKRRTKMSKGTQESVVGDGATMTKASKQAEEKKLQLEKQKVTGKSAMPSSKQRIKTTTKTKNTQQSVVGDGATMTKNALKQAGGKNLQQEESKETQQSVGDGAMTKKATKLHQEQVKVAIPTNEYLIKSTKKSKEIQQSVVGDGVPMAKKSLKQAGEKKLTQEEKSARPSSKQRTKSTTSKATQQPVVGDGVTIEKKALKLESIPPPSKQPRETKSSPQISSRTQSVESKPDMKGRLSLRVCAEKVLTEGIRKIISKPTEQKLPTELISKISPRKLQTEPIESVKVQAPTVPPKYIGNSGYFILTGTGSQLTAQLKALEDEGAGVLKCLQLPPRTLEIVERQLLSLEQNREQILQGMRQKHVAMLASATERRQARTPKKPYKYK